MPLSLCSALHTVTPFYHFGLQSQSLDHPSHRSASSARVYYL
ncbi:hypothetical protein AN0974.2 [Aspergillus nidulans FGSC A4]|uniref:Uncharacterized protein n=2 Tax=Emericella nidulans TaxID=162425 RepID=G5EB42_EMENI|nr:hypothetical protein [Aspergillus nidulans FGSC A4]AAA33301.1 bristle A beta [Aspergillus nidulans]AAB27150.1 mu orf gene product [Aspergillus nidulans]AAB48670.1 brlA [Aspergillus nidulans]EAA66003.1 hypothetical protein AN0974.2 [Aspergillus nidulans FGSC A4]CBF88415.1 TPA: Bristle A betaBrlAMu orf proteinPutative uncharacterized protein;;; [Source:UniProtKB/TrEMBL;Acc:Q12474] [Aspergillus nidulans FGSC A4]|eukprot:XP_658578.1 hypothetical protein AN0974.2 [Aspergillus nidulans FGSC A4]